MDISLRKVNLKHLLHLLAFCYLAVYILHRSKCQKMERSRHVRVDAKALTRFSTGNESRKLLFQQSSKQNARLSIYRVPKSIRKSNEGAYTPVFVSIGPHHHGKEGLQGMDELKKGLLEVFLMRSQKTRSGFLDLIKQRDRILRNCYFEPIETNITELAEMVLEDATFILELFYMNIFKNDSLGDQYMRARFAETPYARGLIMDDLLKLENQLPAFILEELLDFANIRAPYRWKSFDNESAIDANEKLSLAKLTFIFFNARPAFRVKLQKIGDLNSVKFDHFVDFLRLFHLPRDPTTETISRDINDIRATQIPRVVELQEAGVKFMVKPKTSYMFDVEFNQKSGVLSMPHFGLVSSTEILFRNMILFEEFRYPHEQYFAQYLRFINFLVNEPRDVEILVHSGILGNSLIDNNAAATLINDIEKDAIYFSYKFYFTSILDYLISYYNNPWHRFVAKLKRNYFNTPWAAIAAAAASMSLTCSVLQAVFAVLNHKRK